MSERRVILRRMHILLVQWDPDAAARRAESLRAHGHVVDVETVDGAGAYRKVRKGKPDVVVLDLAVRPSHSWQTARPLATTSGPRLVFVDGTDEARAKAGQHAPNATFVSGADLLDSL